MLSWCGKTAWQPVPFSRLSPPVVPDGKQVMIKKNAGRGWNTIPNPESPMRRIIIMVTLLAVIAAAASGCNLKPRLIEPALGQQFELPFGPDALILGEDLRLTFEEVREDSRCALGVICVTAGQAVYTVTMKKGGVTELIQFTEHGLGGEGRASFQGYTIVTYLQPYPAYPDEINPDDYYLDIIVTR